MSMEAGFEHRRLTHPHPIVAKDTQMETEQMERLNAGEPVAMSLADMVIWRQRTSGSRLLLPPIQRSLVWTNKQII